MYDWACHVDAWACMQHHFRSPTSGPVIHSGPALSSHLSKLLNTKRKDAGVSCLPALSETLQHQQVISVRIENAQINTSMTYN